MYVIGSIGPWVAMTAGDELALQGDRLLDPHLAGLEAVGEDVLGRPSGRRRRSRSKRLLGAAGLDHHHGDVAVVELAPGDDQLERAGVALVVGRVGDPLAVRPSRPCGRRRSGPRTGCPQIISAAEAALIDSTSCGLLLVGAEDRGDDLGLVAEALGERRAQRPVGQAAGEDGVLGRTAFTTEERAGDLAGRVRPLLDVDRQREEVHARHARSLAALAVVSTRRATDGGHDGALDLRGKLAGLEGECLVGSRDGTATRRMGSATEGSFQARRPVGLLRASCGAKEPVPSWRPRTSIPCAQESSESATGNRQRFAHVTRSDLPTSHSSIP